MIDRDMMILWKEIRNLWTKFSQTRKMALDMAKVRIPKYKQNGEISKNYNIMWKCACCGELVGKDNRQVDHIVPINHIPRNEAELAEAVSKLFCPLDNLQVLCTVPCHRAKSAKEAEARKKKVSKKKRR